MTARKRLRKFALWFGIAIPLLAAFYLGAYYRMVTTITVVTISMPQNTPIVQRQPRYNLPWPIPSQYNHSELQPGLKQAFTPAHRMDQWLRPDFWASQKADLQIQANGSGVLLISEGTTKPL